MSADEIKGTIEYEESMVVLLPFSYRGVHLTLRAQYSEEVGVWVAFVERGDITAADMDEDSPDEALRGLIERLEQAIDEAVYAQVDEDGDPTCSEFEDTDEARLPFGWHIVSSGESDHE